MSQHPQQPADCSDVILRLFEYVDEEAQPLDADRIRTHLEECGPCLAEYQRELILKALVRRACKCEQAPPALRMQILTSITQVTWVEQREA